ncbi:MAG: CAP domain-containing protein [Planctomycetota bacterium]
MTRELPARLALVALLLLALGAGASAGTQSLPRSIASPASARVDVAADVERLCDRLARARGRERREVVWAELVLLARTHPEAREGLARGLERVWTGANRRLDSRTHRRAFAPLVEQRTRLDALRAETLALVRDVRQYPYPYEPPEATQDQAAAYRITQHRIDENVREMRELWRSRVRAKLGRDLRDAGERVLWVRERAEWLSTEFGVSVPLVFPDGVPAWLHSLPVELEADLVDLTTFALEPAEAKRLARDRAVVQRNRLLFDALAAEAKGGSRGRSAEENGPAAQVALEREQIELTNDYRRMFGVPALAWNRRLHGAVRNHAEYLSRQGVLGHDQDNARYTTKERRARHFGYSGPVWENCHFGSATARGALQAWTRSSAHHRALLGARMTEMATATTGRYWVQKFGLDTAFESEIQWHPWRD